MLVSIFNRVAIVQQNVMNGPYHYSSTNDGLVLKIKADVKRL